jgi:hypothetical protein
MEAPMKTMVPPSDEGGAMDRELGANTPGINDCLFIRGKGE